MSEPRNADDYCYRHPDRRSYVLCQRCLRTICPECQTQGAVGVICPECMKAQRDSAPRPVRRAASLARVRDSRPLATYAILAITVAVSLISEIPGVPLRSFLLFNSAFLDGSLGAPFQPWRMLTVLLVHGGFAHLALNMLALWLLGRSLEPLLGRGRFVALYLLSGLGGSVAVTILAPTVSVVGASGAIFGLFGALLIIGRHIGANVTGIAVILAINLAIGFFPGFSISWQAHVGGLIVGALMGFVFARTRRANQQGLQIGLLVAIGLALVGITVVAAIL